MTPRESIKRGLVNQWLEKSQEDLLAAELLLETNPVLPGVVAFHAQQAAEKILKGFLTWREVDFPKTHSIDLLVKLAGVADNVLQAKLSHAYVLTDYAVELRYPIDVPPLSKEAAVAAVRLAVQVKEAVVEALDEAGY